MCILTRSAAAFGLLLLGSSLANGQEGAPGMDEIDASVSAASGDTFDAFKAHNQAISELQDNNRDLDRRMDDLDARLRVLEEERAREN